MKQLGITEMAHPLFDKYKPATPISTIARPTDTLSEIMKIYESLLHESQFNSANASGLTSHPREYKEKLDAISGSLTPGEIQHFLNITTPFENEIQYQNITGILTSYLIQRSHDAGHNTFTLNCHGTKPINNLCRGIIMQPGRDLRVLLLGEVGTATAMQTTGGTYYIESTGSWLGYGAHNLTLYCERATNNAGNALKGVNMYLQHAGGFCGNNINLDPINPSSPHTTFYAQNLGDNCFDHSVNVTCILHKVGAYSFSNASDCQVYVNEIGNKPGEEGHSVSFYSSSFNPLQSIIDSMISTHRIPLEQLHLVQEIPFTFITEEEWNTQWEKAEAGFAHLQDVLKRGFL